MASSGNEDELMARFQEITGANAERAKFYMEASGWDFQLAVAGFYEGESDQLEQESLGQEAPNFNPALAGVGSADPDVPSSLQQPTLPISSGISKPGPKPTPRGGLATLDSLRQQEENSSDDDEKGQAFFAGGSITSGQQVLGPPTKKKDEFIKELFEKAKEHGATSEDPFAPTKASSSFGGAGYKLGDLAGGSTESVRPAESSRFASLEPREVTLRLWRTGFTVDDGELRLYTDPENMAFLDSIKAGEIPRELIRSHPGQEVQLAMEDHRHEQYEPPKAPVNPFSGQGHMLGSPTPLVVTSRASESSEDRNVNEENARSLINLAENQPTTNLQIRLADGTRLVARFNHTHRISDLHTFINMARPQYSSANYILTLFPNRDLTDMEATLKDANILNAALTQKIKSSA